MAILAGRMQRLPEIDEALAGQYARISKAEWAELYFDLFRETHGEDVGDEEIMADAERRLVTIKRWCEAERSGDMRGVPCFLCGHPVETTGHQCHPR
jgi:hypothetical protein